MAAPQRKSSEKLTEYLQMEASAQKLWSSHKAFEPVGPAEQQQFESGKFFATFPYPYMNGKLHLGHSFSLSKVEFYVRYKRLTGHQCLLPLGFHCTGMPILACADKLKREMAMYGNPPKFPSEEEEETEKMENGQGDDAKLDADALAAQNKTKNKGKAKKTKVAAKSGTAKFQWQIMRENIKLSPEESANLTEEQCQSKIDLEIAKFANPEYWFEYFPREAITDLQAFGLSADWRRTFITTEKNPYYDSFVRWQFWHLKKNNRIKFGKRHTIYSPRDQQPCMDHDRATGEGVAPLEYTLFKIKLKNPLPETLDHMIEANSKSKVFLLVATLEPDTMLEQSDSWIKPETKYVVFKLLNDEVGICSERTALNMSYQNLTPNNGKVDALCELKGQQLLQCALEEDLTNRIKYMEPEKQVMSRSGEECVVALCDQWYLDYGDESWKQDVKKALSQLETYTEETKRNFEITVDWLHEYACSRTYGLGTKLPWDEQWLVESLSDSTIYMAYYTVSQYLQHNSLVESPDNSFGTISPAHMTPSVWNYIFFGDDTNINDSQISREHLEEMRRQFLYWYPVDLRSSGKDLIANHLTFSLYNHCAVWQDQPNMWPKAFRVNGHLLLNGEKMSKSTGNFLTLQDAINIYSADGVRFALADSGDAIEDANFVAKQAETGLLKLSNYYKWCIETIGSIDQLRSGPIESFADLAFQNAMNRYISSTRSHYENMMFKEALKDGFFEYQDLRLKYRDLCGDLGMHKELTLRFIYTQTVILSPICPHIAEKLKEVMPQTKDSTLFTTSVRWPVTEDVDEDLYKSYEYLMDVSHEFRIRLKTFQLASLKSSKKSKASEIQGAPQKASKATIYVARTFPVWQATISEALHELYIEHCGSMPENKIIASKLSKIESLKRYMKKAMPFAEMRKQLIVKQGESAFDQTAPFNELKVFEENLTYLRNTLDIQDIQLKEVDDTADVKIQEECCPMQPFIMYI